MADPKYEVKDVRRVLAYLRDHPWNSREELRDGCGLGHRTLMWIIENECSLRTESRVARGGGPKRLCYALPAEVSRN